MPRRSDNWRQLIPGLLCVGVLVALALGILVFARVGALHGDTVPLYAATGQARGVGKGTDVWLAGVKVGIVKDVRFRSIAADTGDRLLLELEILEEYLPYVRRDARTQIRSGGTLLGAPVLYLSGGTSASPPVRPLDTLRTLPQHDPEGLTSAFARSSQEFPAIVANVKVLGAQLRGTSGTAGAILNLDDGNNELTGLRNRAGALGRRAAAGQGTLGLALGGGDVVVRARRAMLRVDSLRTLVTDTTAALNRFKSATALLREVDELRTEVALARGLLTEPRGTAGRALRDSALVRQLARAQGELDSLFADMKANPLRYWPF